MRVKLFVLAAALLAAPQNYEKNISPEHPAIQYMGAAADPIAELSRKIDGGQVTLAYRTDGSGYLPAILDQLGVPRDSQALVFSKTGLQAFATAPRTPRAIYFSDSVAIGVVRGADRLEFVATDPRQGAIFYAMDAAKSERPRIERETLCLQCHQGPATAGIPGMYVGSVFPTASGNANFRSGAIVTDQRTAFEDRWGGWYVSGTHGSQKHRGNAVALDPSNPFVLETEGTQNLTSLDRKFDTSKYLLPTSDIVALMTFEHQTQMINLMIRAGWESRTGEVSPRTIDDLVDYMTFANEIPIKEPIEGVSTFTKTFPQRGPKDKMGRSLRDFDLKKRLFRYPLSYLIYSDTFDAMPGPVQVDVYKKLFEALNSKDPNGRAAIAIVRETKRGLPSFWR